MALKYAKNALAAGALPRTPPGELTTLPRPPSWLGRGHLLPRPDPLATRCSFFNPSRTTFWNVPAPMESSCSHMWLRGSDRRVLTATVLVKGSMANSDPPPLYRIDTPQPIAKMSVMWTVSQIWYSSTRRACVKLCEMKRIFYLYHFQGTFLEVRSLDCF